MYVYVYVHVYVHVNVHVYAHAYAYMSDPTSSRRVVLFNTAQACVLVCLLLCSRRCAIIPS